MEAASVTEPTRRRLKQAEVLAEWIETDFETAFAFLESEGFQSLSLPGIAQMIAKRADTSHLAVIVNKAGLPVDSLVTIGQFLSSAQVVELAESTHLIESGRKTAASGVIAGLLASRNLDSALHYAGSLPSDQSASAYAGIIDELSSNNSAEQAREIFRSLPDDTRSRDAVLFAYGNAVRDIDPGEALHTLSSIQDAQYRKLALVAFSRKIEASSPSAAIQAILTGLGAAGFENQVPRVLKTWSAHDAVAAREFVASTSWIPADQRQRLLTLVDEGARSPDPAP